MKIDGVVKGLSKVPWKKVLKVGGKVGAILVVASGVSKAAELDENTQELVKKIASKSVKKEAGAD